MIALLRGRVVAAALGEVVLDVGGVGYQVHVPPTAVHAGLGAETTLHTYLAVREDAMTLYGFAEPSAKALFVALLSVTGVGPKLALAAIGTLGAEGLRRAVVTEDVAALTVVPGVGRKSAQRIVLELREKLGAAGGDDVTVSVTGLPVDARDEVRQALAALGYAPVEVVRALDAVNGDTDGTPEELLRGALRVLGRK